MGPPQIGRSARRKEGRAKVTGQALYVDDVAPAGVLHGVTVEDPYRWLEDGKSPEVQAWMTAQDTLARGQLKKHPERDAIAERDGPLANGQTDRCLGAFASGPGEHRVLDARDAADEIELDSPCGHARWACHAVSGASA